MAGEGPGRKPNGARARTRAWAEEFGRPGRSAGIAGPHSASAFAERLRTVVSAWIASDIAPGRLFAWLPVAFGAGMVVYFTAPREPVWWMAAAATLVIAFATYGLRRRPFGFAVSLALTTAAFGFTVAAFKASWIAHPVLAQATAFVSVTGFVEVQEERTRSDRIVVRVQSMTGLRVGEAPRRVRVAVRKGTAPTVGDFVSFKARLTPPLQPLRPGGYDFARDMYFQGIGASGFVLGTVTVETPTQAPGLWLRYATMIEATRNIIDRRIRSALPGDVGSIASALITGKRDAISTPVNDAMYISSLAHVLSISGYHMAVVAGLTFFIIRAGFALYAPIATRYPIKKWAAVAALLTSTFYLLLSGAEVATQRSYIMIAIVLVSVLADRPALTFRTLAIAALGVLLFAPEAVVHPSFQMSFAATLALVAAYYRGLPWQVNVDTPLGARIALWGVREVIGLILASVVAGLATTPYAAFHFHRLAPYGVIANLAAMPVVSAWVMPMGILGALAVPFGFDGLFWPLMGLGIEWMDAVALWVAGLPGALGRMAAFGTGPLLLVTAGMLVLCLLRSPLRWGGAGICVAASIWAWSVPQPDGYVAADGQTVAVRGPEGRLSLLAGGKDQFAVREWLAADADARLPRDSSLKSGIACDDAGCVASGLRGQIMAYSKSSESLSDDCSRSSITVMNYDKPFDCRAYLLDRRALRGGGAQTFRWQDDELVVTAARPPGAERPWNLSVSNSTQRTDASPASTNPPRRARPRDATPAETDLEAEDVSVPAE